MWKNGKNFLKSKNSLAYVSMIEVAFRILCISIKIIFAAFEVPHDKSRYY